MTSLSLFSRLRPVAAEADVLLIGGLGPVADEADVLLEGKCASDPLAQR